MPIPAALQPLWDSLRNEVIKVNAYWDAYKTLFLSSEKRARHLKQQAPIFFDLILRDTLIDSVQLLLGRLGDPSVTGRGKKGARSNATLKRLFEEFVSLHPTMTAKIDDFSDRLSEFASSCEKIRDRRNKQIAHNDYDALIKQYSYGTGLAPDPPIEPATQAEIESALECLSSFMNGIEALLSCGTNDDGSSTKTVTDYRFRSDAEQIVNTIKESMRYRELTDSGKIVREQIHSLAAFCW